MNKRELVWSAAFIVWRTFQTMVVVPASIIGVVVVVLALLGEAPVRALVEGVYEYADSQVRRASPGTVLSHECLAPLPAKEIPRRPAPICEEYREIEVPISTAVNSALHTLTTLYAILVALSFVWVVGLHPGRRFIGLPQRSTG